MGINLNRNINVGLGGIWGEVGWGRGSISPSSK